MTGHAAWRLEDELTFEVRPESVRQLFAAFHPPEGVLSSGDLAFAYRGPRRSERLYCYLLDQESEVSRLVLDLRRPRASLSQKRRSPGTTDERSRRLGDAELDRFGASAVTAAFVKLKLLTRYSTLKGAEAFHVGFDLIIPVDRDWQLVPASGFHHLEIESRQARWQSEELAARFAPRVARHLRPAASKPRLVRERLAAASAYPPLPDARGLGELREELRRRLRKLSQEPPIRDFLSLGRAG